MTYKRALGPPHPPYSPTSDHSHDQVATRRVSQGMQSESVTNCGDIMSALQLRSEGLVEIHKSVRCAYVGQARVLPPPGSAS